MRVFTVLSQQHPVHQLLILRIPGIQETRDCIEQLRQQDHLEQISVRSSSPRVIIIH